jgi:hypothetical protein
VFCTQITPITCNSCFPDALTPPAEDINKNISFLNGTWEPTSPAFTPPTETPFTSPPTSPRSLSSAFNPYFGNVRRSSAASEPEKEACDNCNFVVTTDPSVPSSSQTILRTGHKVSAYGLSPSADIEHNEDLVHPPTAYLSTSPTPSQLSTSSGSSHSHMHNPIFSRAYLTHAHNLTYITRRNPDSQSLYARLRMSCLRALSCEALPKGSSSGPLLFGDPIAGYTIAYLFRLPDPNARGRRRTYALQALTPDCSRATQSFTNITKAFETIANHIILLTNQAIERETLGLFPPESVFSSSPPNSDLPGSSPEKLVQSRAKSSTNSPISSTRNLTDVSSFLVAKKVDPDGYARGSSREAMRGKGLPEIVGKDRFFVELHAKFVMILYNLLSGLR